MKIALVVVVIVLGIVIYLSTRKREYKDRGTSSANRGSSTRDPKQKL